MRILSGHDQDGGARRIAKIPSHRRGGAPHWQDASRQIDHQMPPEIFALIEPQDHLDCCLFDISDSESLNEAEKLLQPLRTSLNLTKVLVGNKIDLEYWRRV
jgi:hypothetical protein